MSSIIQRSLSGGELDPVLWARADVTKYQTGLRTLRNAYVRRNGGVQGRPGSTMLATPPPTSNSARLIPFIYSQSVTYVIEISQTNPVMRFYKNGALYTASGALPYNNATNYKWGDLVTSGGNTYMAIYPQFDFDPRETGGSLFTFSGSAPPGGNWQLLTNNVYEIPIPNPYATSLFDIRYDQSGNDVRLALNNGLAGGVIAQMVLRRWQDSNGNDVFGLFNTYVGSKMQAANPTNNQGDSNTLSIAAAATVYAVAAVGSTGDEYPEKVAANGTPSLAVGTDVTTTNTVPSAGTPITINWSAVTNAVAYNIYFMNKNTNVFGFLGSTSNTTFKDNGITPDYSNAWVQRATTMMNLYGGSTVNCPGAVGYHQQRLFFGNTPNNPTTVYGSQTGLYDNFNVNVPSVATDALSFKMAGAQDVIQHLLSLGTLLVFTYGSINSVNGDSSGAISPSAINPHRESVHGASSLKPLIVGEFALYAQSQGSVIRDLGFNFQVDGYRGDDLTVFSTHLFDNYTIKDWAYQSIPHSVIWAVRSDGALLSLTYVREQQILAWAHHDTNGTYESVCCIPEGNQVSVYVVVNRGGTRYIERFYNQQFTDVRNYIGMDCATTFDGRNTSGDTVTITGGTNWDSTELLTMTLNHNNFLTFTSQMATNNDMIFVYDASGNLYRFKITTFVSATSVKGFMDRTVAASLQSTPTASWSHAMSTFTGLSYLNGYKVSIFADGTVVGSPNNSNIATVYTVSGGQVVLDQPYVVVAIGLPFITDIETLDLDIPGEMDNQGARYKFIGEVTIYMVNSRTVFVGSQNPDTDLTNTSSNPIYRLTEQKVRQYENYDSPINLKTGKHTQTIQGQWDQNGHTFIRNVDPTPLIVSAISPEGLAPLRMG